MTIAASAHEIRSPVESSMSISRGCGRSETSWAIATSSSVVLPRAESTATTRLPASFAATIRPAARLIRSASATEVPPNFITTVWRSSGSAWRAKDSFRRLAAPASRSRATAPTALGVDRSRARRRRGVGIAVAASRGRRRSGATAPEAGGAAASAARADLVPRPADPAAARARAGRRACRARSADLARGCRSSARWRS